YIHHRHREHRDGPRRTQFHVRNTDQYSCPHHRHRPTQQRRYLRRPLQCQLARFRQQPAGCVFHRFHARSHRITYRLHPFLDHVPNRFHSFPYCFTHIPSTLHHRLTHILHIVHKLVPRVTLYLARRWRRQRAAVYHFPRPHPRSHRFRFHLLRLVGLAHAHPSAHRPTTTITLLDRVRQFMRQQSLPGCSLRLIAPRAKVDVLPLSESFRLDVLRGPRRPRTGVHPHRSQVRTQRALHIFLRRFGQQCATIGSHDPLH